MNGKQKKTVLIGLSALTAMVLAGIFVWNHSTEEAVLTQTPPTKQTEPPTKSSTEPPTQPPTEPPAPKEGGPSKYASLDEDVEIELDEEPRLNSPLQTHVAPTDETYSVYFRNPMNRASVEAAITSNLNQSNYGSDNQEVTFTASFRWVNDQELQVSVKVPANLEQQDGYRLSYNINAKGAKMQNGTLLPDSAPSLTAFLKQPVQLWRVSLDGKIRERATTLTEPYRVSVLATERYLFLERNANYCCHGPYTMYHSLYDTTAQTRISYPNKLHIDYMGPGEFVADTRGFFYAKPDSGMSVPKSDTTVAVKVNGYVHGATFSQDRSRVVMAVGTEKQEGDYDLVIHDLKTGEQKRLPKAVKFNYMPDIAHGAKFPVKFTDDGTNVYFSTAETIQNPDYYQVAIPYVFHRFQYTWKTGQVSEWKAPVADGGYAGPFYASSDGVYRLYPYDGLYKGEQKVSDVINQGTGGAWVAGTHLYAITDNSTDGLRTLSVYDADRDESSKLIEKLPTDSHVTGTSADGKWIYLNTTADLK